MIYKNLGSTNLKISAIGLGMGFDFENKKLDSKKIVRVLRQGISLGMNFIDTAESYGDGVGEEIAGMAIRGLREKIIIASKFSPENSSFRQLIASCNLSLKRLKTDYIDIYQFHWSNPSIPLYKTLGALLKLKKQGKIRFIGGGNFSKKKLQKICNELKNENLVSLQTEYNLFERTIEQNGVLKFCQKNALSVFAASPLNQGQFNALSQNQSELMHSLCRKYLKTLAQIILSWIISHNNVIAIPRTLSQTHLLENADLLTFSLTNEDIKKMDKAFFMRIEYVSIDKITISKKGESNSRVFYQNLNEAKENKLGFTPSPQELAKEIKESGFLKPVKLVKNKSKNGNFNLVAGGMRYWAWVMAYGNKRPIPAHIRDHL